MHGSFVHAKRCDEGGHSDELREQHIGIDLGYCRDHGLTFRILMILALELHKVWVLAFKMAYMM